LQNLGVLMPTAAKSALIDAIAAAGVPEIDAGSFVPAKVRSVSLRSCGGWLDG